MGKSVLWTSILTGLFLVVSGCGSDDDFQAGNRLIVTKVADSAGSTAPVFMAVEETDDTGLDGKPNTGDQGENDGRPDPGEAILTPLEPDLGVVSLKNESRLGVDPGVDLQVYRVDVTYLDAFGNSRSFAPTQNYGVSVTVPNDGTVDLDTVLMPLGIKIPPAGGGLRDNFLDPSQTASVSKMTAIVDVYAKDIRNNDKVHAQGSITLTFINPMVSQKPQ